MARDHARVNVTIWGDPNFRRLPPAAQHLYLLLWTSPELTYAGTHDWRPARLTGRAEGWTRADVEAAADCLAARHFLVIDNDVEEVLIRSWIRWDGLMKQPRMAISCTTAYAAAASDTLKAVIVHQLHAEKERQPDLTCWADPRVQEVLTHPSIDPKTLPTPDDPFGDGVGHGFRIDLAQMQGKVSGSVSVPPTPAPAPTPNSSPPSAGKPAPSSADAADEKNNRDDIKALCKHLSKNLTANDVKHTIGKGWHDAARLILDRDGRDLNEAHRLIDWATSDPFWKTNVLSMPKFREKYDQLRLKAQAQPGNVNRLPSAGPTPGTPEFDALPFEEQARITARRNQAWRTNL